MRTTGACRWTARILTVLLALGPVLGLVACSTTSSLRGSASAGEAADAYWQGKLALRIDESAGAKSYAANFELIGSARRGELLLTGPLGTTVARLSWRPGQAVLQRSGDAEVFDDLDALAARATGTPLPVAALFEWLQGHPMVAQGWQADLTQLGDGRLRAHRDLPPPQADLQLVLER